MLWWAKKLHVENVWHRSLLTWIPLLNAFLTSSKGELMTQEAIKEMTRAFWIMEQVNIWICIMAPMNLWVWITAPVNLGSTTKFLNLNHRVSASLTLNYGAKDSLNLIYGSSETESESWSQRISESQLCTDESLNQRVNFWIWTREQVNL